MDFSSSNSRLSTVISRIGSSIPNQIEVQKFLETPDIYKNNSTRFIAWLIETSILTLNRSGWTGEIRRLVEDYYTVLQASLPDTNVLSVLDQQSAMVIQADIERSQDWFCVMSRQLDLDPSIIDVIGIGHRVLALLTVRHPDFYNDEPCFISSIC